MPARRLLRAPPPPRASLPLSACAPPEPVVTLGVPNSSKTVNLTGSPIPCGRIRRMPPSVRAWEAVGDLYHAYLTGLILTVVTRRSAADAAALVFRLFRRQQLEKFLPVFEK